MKNTRLQSWQKTAGGLKSVLVPNEVTDEAMPQDEGRYGRIDY